MARRVVSCCFALHRPELAAAPQILDAAAEQVAAATEQMAALVSRYESDLGLLPSSRRRMPAAQHGAQDDPALRA